MQKEHNGKEKVVKSTHTVHALCIVPRAPCVCLSLWIFLDVRFASFGGMACLSWLSVLPQLSCSPPPPPLGLLLNSHAAKPLVCPPPPDTGLFLQSSYAQPSSGDLNWHQALAADLNIC